MSARLSLRSTETQKKRSLLRRMLIVHGVFVVALLLIVSRLLELQVLRGGEYREIAQAQHYGGVKLPAKRGEIYAFNSKTGEQNILATNTTLDLLYVDPLITTNPTRVAETLSDLLLTEEFHAACTNGKDTCPRELIPFYAPAFDALTQYTLLHTGALLEPLPTGELPRTLLKLPDIVEARRLYARDIEQRISGKRITFVPLKYGATKVQLAAVASLQIPGLVVSTDDKLIWANPEEIQQMRIPSISRALSVALETDSKRIADLLRSRPLRYVAVMRRLPPSLSLLVKEAQIANYKKAVEEAREGQGQRVGEVDYNLRSVALLPEHWRYYPDATVGSHVVGFLNATQEPQYGVERTFNAQLRGQEGLISTVSDPHGGQILTPEQTIITPRDGDTLVLTIDRAVQREVEQRLQAAVDQYRADSGQAIVMDPFTGRIIAMANAPLFDGNDYASVYEKEPMTLSTEHLQTVVVEVYHPETNERVVKAYMKDVFTEEGRTLLTEKTRKAMENLEKLYDLRDLTRYYFYVGQNLRMEIFPTERPDIWLKFKNTIGVGAYLNRTIQEIYEPGSVLKPITMAIALDQGEVQPGDIYDDTGPVEVDEYKIDNNDKKHYGRVTMTACLEYSINTCMTSIGFKLGQKLFYRTLERFGFGKITSIELEDELPGELRSWREWSRSLLATTAFGQGLSSTPLQVITAWAALANGGKLMRPSIIDSVIHADGSVEKTEPRFVDQVIQPKTSETITAMLVSSATKGFAKTGKVKGYRIAGKTGTSQIAGPGGKYETGTGSTFATYAGYAPIGHPRFVVLVKIDRPKNVTHGATAAAPVFREIAEFLFKYYGIEPDEK
ncbi:MAG: penicillin-binding protein 2 [Candidatus Peribacteraceae bacterium]|jgi:cell division protein FtsI/penicillin-binding protein 2